jgi:membrane fusion protein, multidrug efflux system
LAEWPKSFEATAVPKRVKRTIWLVIALALCAGAAALFAKQQSGGAASSTQGGASSPPAIPVTAQAAKLQDVPIIIRGLGTVTAYNTVSVKSRVTGNVTQINFREGQEVKTGDLLIQLDPRPYQAALDQAKATKARDEANLENDRKDLARYSQLVQKQFAPEQQFATQQATVAAAEATVQMDQAAIDSAALNLEYASIRSPIDGITGIRQVDLGNLVQANGQVLVVLTQITPTYVIATVPEADISPIRAAMAQHPIEVAAYDADDQKQISMGTLQLIDNQVDASTGTVRLKAEFANQDKALWPGQFVNAHIIVETVKDGVTIPSAAVQNGPHGSFVYVVTKDDTAEQRSVTIRQTENNVSLVGSGLKTDEMIVTAGQSKLIPGAKVKVTNGNGGSPATAQSGLPPQASGS